MEPGAPSPALAREELVDKIKGCIYGAALGDAFGLATEFMTKAKARTIYGVGPIKFGKDSGIEFFRDSHRSRWHENDFTDDTDQMLIILQSLLETNGTFSAKHFAPRLKDWSQVGFPELRKVPCGIGYTVGSTFSHPDFENHPHKAAYVIWDCNKRDLAANGAVMRTAVLGIPFFHDETTVVRNAINAAKVTHADPRSVASAVIVSVLVARMLRGIVKCAGTDDEVVRNKKKYERLLLHGCGNTEDDDEYEDEPVKLDEGMPPPTAEVPIVPKHKIKIVFERVVNYFRGNAAKYESKYDVPCFQPPLEQEKPKMPEIMPLSMDTYGDDVKMMDLCKQVVDDYKFFLQGNSLCPQEDEISIENESEWIKALRGHCFPKSLETLGLDAGKSIGYTLKCLGAGIYCCSRAIPENMSPSTFFKNLITELTLEAGDADTNCAVAGALLGCRLGFSNLPSAWVKGLRHAAHLEKLTDQLCSLALDHLEKSGVKH